jgi:hypothetical protein
LQREIPQLKFTGFRWPVHGSRLPFNTAPQWAWGNGGSLTI